MATVLGAEVIKDGGTCSMIYFLHIDKYSRVAMIILILNIDNSRIVVVLFSFLAVSTLPQSIVISLVFLVLRRVSRISRRLTFYCLKLQNEKKKGILL